MISLRGSDHTAFLRSITSTAELAFSLMLSLVRNIPKAHNSVINDRQWSRDLFIGHELSGLAIGLIGFGRLGHKMAQLCKAFDMKIYVYDPKIDENVFNSFGVKVMSWEGVFSNSDIISIHASFNKDNYQIITKKELGLVKPGSYLINTARGELINEHDLCEFIRRDHFSGVGLDVLDNEQNVEKLLNKEIINLAKDRNDVIITPHIGGCCHESMAKTENYVAQLLLEDIYES